MRRSILATAFLIPLAFTAACSKKVVATTPAPNRVPVAETPRSEPQPVKTVDRTKPQQAAPNRASTGITPEERRQLNESVARLEDALFDYDKATIRPDAQQALHQDIDVIRTILTRYPSENLRLEGHADERGSSEYNLGLGDRRAESVKEFLTLNGVPAAQLTTISYGKDRPVCSESTESCWQQNRRVHVVATTAQR